MSISRMLATSFLVSVLFSAFSLFGLPANEAKAAYSVPTVQMASLHASVSQDLSTSIQDIQIAGDRSLVQNGQDFQLIAKQKKATKKKANKGKRKGHTKANKKKKGGKKKAGKKKAGKKKAQRKR